MKPNRILYTAALIASLSAVYCKAEERASLNAQEYDCRQNIKECLSLKDEARKECYLSPSLAESCFSSPLHRLLLLRADAENELSIRDCLKKIDGELSGLLTKDAYAAQEIHGLEKQLAQCRQSTSDEILKP